MYRNMKSTQRTGAKRIAGITADVIFTLVLLLSLFAAVTALGFRAGGRFMGLGIVQSGSMQNSGLNKGDVVAVRPQDEYRAGDIIVFYRAPERYGEAYDPSIRAEIWIHEIIDVRTDSLGRQTYLTKGSSNAADDGFYVPQDFVLGTAARLPGALSAFFRFTASAAGIWCLVIVPCAILLVYLAWDLVMLLTQKREVPEGEFAVSQTEGTPEQRAAPFSERQTFTYTFFVRLHTAEEAVRQRVNALENQLLSYRNGRARARGRLGKKYKTYRVGRVPFARLCLRGKTVIMYLALPYEKAAAAYKNVRDKSDIRKYQKFPSEVRIKSELALQKALRLIEQSALENGFEKNAPFVPLPVPPAVPMEGLLAAGYIVPRKAFFAFPERSERETVRENEEESAVCVSDGENAEIL